MRLLLDTSVAIAFRNVDRIVDRVASSSPTLLLSALSVAELESGTTRDPEDQQRRAVALTALLRGVEVLPLSLADARRYGEIVREAGFARSKIIDRLIAAQALNQEAELATLNARDFADIPGLRIHDWSR